MSASIGNTETEYITPQELHVRWKGRISVRTLSNWRSLGTGPKFTKVGGRILYPLDEVIAWECKNTSASTADYRR